MKATVFACVGFLGGVTAMFAAMRYTGAHLGWKGVFGAGAVAAVLGWMMGRADSAKVEEKNSP